MFLFLFNLLCDLFNSLRPVSVLALHHLRCPHCIACFPFSFWFAWGGTLDIIMTTNMSSFHFFSAALLFFLAVVVRLPFWVRYIPSRALFRIAKSWRHGGERSLGSHSTVRLPVAGRVRARRDGWLFFLLIRVEGLVWTARVWRRVYNIANANAYTRSQLLGLSCRAV
jgi:hypothetical protein